MYGFAIRVGGNPRRLVEIETIGLAMKLLCGTFVLAVFCCIGARAADVITFETAPDRTTPIDDALLNSPYSIAGGTIRFFFDVNGDNRYNPAVDALPAFEVAGCDEHNAFATAWDNSSDTPRPGYVAQLGSYFLRVAGAQASSSLPPQLPGPFIAQCRTTQIITGLSGEIWDIDGGSNGGTEQWRVEVLDNLGSVLSTEVSPLGVDDSNSSLDGLPWTFSFSGLPSTAQSLRLTFIGSKSNGSAVAFNNFSVTSVPEPSGLILSTLALFAVAVTLRARSA